MQFRILGPIEVTGREGPLQIDAGKARGLLARLLLSANEVVATDRLIDALWGQDPPATAEHAIEVYVSRLRRTIGADRIITAPPGYMIRVEPGELDLDRFVAAAAEAREAIAAGHPDAAADLLVEADGLWRGPALTDLSESPAEAARLDGLRLGALEERMDAALAAGRHAEVVPELERLVVEHPYRERLRGQHMLALYRAGRQADALQAYSNTRATLDADLGLEPGPDLQRLQLAILRQDPWLDPPAAHPVAGEASRSGAAEPIPAAGIPMAGAGPDVPPRHRPTRWLAGATLLTAVAAILIAIVGSLTLAPPLRPTGSPDATTAAVRTTAEPADGGWSPTTQEAALLDRVPTGVREWCQRTESGQGGTGGMASLRCPLPRGSEVDMVWYDVFRDDATLRPVFDALVEAQHLIPGSCETATGVVEPWALGVTFSGRRACYQADGASWIAWTYDFDEPIVGMAIRSGTDDRSLFDWWRTVGPFLR